jgi:hypothetical protein
MAFTCADLVEPATGLAGRAHKEPESGITTAEGVENFVSDSFSFIDKQRSRGLELIVDTLDVSACVG